MTDITTETTFDVAASPGDAWKALEELRARTTKPGEWWLPGFDCRVAEVAAEHHRSLTVRKLEEPCAGTLIAITFEHASTGARLRVVQSGFDQAFLDQAGGSFWTHAEHIFRDLHLFFETGVISRRAWQPWAPLGVAASVEPYGLRVQRVGGGTWAERIGLQRDDVLLTVAGAPLYTTDELAVVERIVHRGDDVDASWIHDGERVEASATL
jgi:hypothetical protein